MADVPSGDELARLNLRLQELVEQAERERDPIKLTAITREIWRVIAERDQLRGSEGSGLRSPELP